MRRHLFDEFTEVDVVDPEKPASRHRNDLKVDPLAKLHSAILKGLLVVDVLAHPRMATYEVGQARVIGELVTTFVDALEFDIKAQKLGKKARLGIFPADMRDALEAAADEPPELLRLVADHIAGMTDGYAIRLHARLTGAGAGSFNEFV